MYEALMNLPLFRGASLELMSDFVGKTHLDFRTYNVGETVVAPGDNCSTLRCLLSGSVRMVHPLFGGSILIKEIAGPGRFFGVERLFGMDNNIPFGVEAVTRCGTMEVSKAQYLDLLRSDSVYLINLLNYLSRTSQKFEDVFIQSKASSLKSLLGVYIELTTNWQSSEVSVESTSGSLLSFMRSVLPFEPAELRNLEAMGLIKVVSDSVWLIPDRSEIISD